MDVAMTCRGVRRRVTRAIRTLIFACFTSALAVPPARAAGVEVARWRPFVDEASSRFGVPVAWIERVMTQESRGRTAHRGRPITSVKGAMGLMQLMPLTWRTMRAELGLGADPYDPHDNIIAGTAYLRWLYDRFGYPGMFAAYSAGPGRYGEFVARGRSLPGETRRYVAAIVGGVTAAPAAPVASTEQHLFVVISSGGDRPPAASSGVSNGLFVARSSP